MIGAVFDDPNLVWCAVPVMALADKAGLAGLIGAHLSIDKPAGINPEMKTGSLVAGMIAGAGPAV